MRVRYLVSSSGHHDTVVAGEERELDEKAAKRLIAMGRAVPVENRQVETAAKTKKGKKRTYPK